MSRLALTDADREARDWFVEATKAAGCSITIDEMGNIFAIRPGNRDDARPTCAGSHMDTQPSGGRYDGILGVTAAVEMLKTLNDNWITTEQPVAVINWTKYVDLGNASFSMSDTAKQRGRCPLSNVHGILKRMGRSSPHREGP